LKGVVWGRESVVTASSLFLFLLFTLLVFCVFL
jgi:hypothetical protein